MSDDVYDDWLRWMAPSGMSNHAHGGNALAPDDNDGMGGHLGPQPWHAMTDQSAVRRSSRGAGAGARHGAEVPDGGGREGGRLACR